MRSTCPLPTVVTGIRARRPNRSRVPITVIFKLQKGLPIPDRLQQRAGHQAATDPPRHRAEVLNPLFQVVVEEVRLQELRVGDK